MYAGQQDDGGGDFIAITIRNKSVEFTFDTGSGTATLRSVSNILEPEDWTTIVASREFNEGTLVVGSLFPPVKGRAPGHTRGLNLKTALFVGGIAGDRISISSHIGVQHGFDGCVASIEVNGRGLDLVNDAIEAFNIEECGNGPPCARQPCKNGGTCVDVGGGQFQCRCQPGFTGNYVTFDVTRRLILFNG